MLFIVILLVFGTWKVNSDEFSDKPLLQELLVPKNLSENQTVRLNCNLLQGESANFNWYLNDRQLEETNRRRIKLNDDSSELVIKQVSVDDLGDYKCVAEKNGFQDMQIVSLLMNG